MTAAWVATLFGVLHWEKSETDRDGFHHPFELCHCLKVFLNRDENCF